MFGNRLPQFSGTADRAIAKAAAMAHRQIGKRRKVAVENGRVHIVWPSSSRTPAGRRFNRIVRLLPGGRRRKGKEGSHD